MPTQITGLLGSPQDDGSLLPLDGAFLYISPSQSTQLRIQYGGTGDFSLVTANTLLPAPYQYGFKTETDVAGTYEFQLPKLTEIHTPDAAFKWNISLPDGSVYSGPALSSSGPLSLDDLIESYNWELSSSLQVQTTILGQVAQETLTVTGQDLIEVSFANNPMADDNYQVICSPGKDDSTEQIPGYDVIEKTANGFKIELTFPLTGTLDYLAWHP